jgi:hypothetical protein
MASESPSVAPQTQIVSAEAKSVSVSTEQPSGAMVVQMYTTRQMKVYAIPEPELNMLQALSSDKTFWSSVGSGALVLLLGCLWDWSQLAPPASPSPTAKLFAAVLVIVCLFSFGRAAWRKWTVKQTLEKILSESEVR